MFVIIELKKLYTKSIQKNLKKKEKQELLSESANSA